MVHTYRSPAVLALASVVLMYQASICGGQPIEYSSQDLAQWKKEARFSFSLTQPDDANRIAKMRNIAVLEAVLTLEKLSRQELMSHDDEPKRAAKVLLMLGGGGQRGLALLCKHLTMKGEGGSEAVPLDDFFVAQGLVGIGGQARKAIFESLRQPLSRKDLLIRAHVLEQMEPPSIMREYIRLALKDQEERETVGGIAVNEAYKGQLRLIEYWLHDPEYLKAPINWP